MKMALALLVVTLLFTLPALSQGGRWAVGFGPSVAFPSGDLSSTNNVGSGGLADGTYHFDQNFSAGLKSGYLYFGGKTLSEVVSSHSSVSATASDAIVPIVATGKYYFMPGDTRVFGALDLGWYYQSISGSVTATVQGVAANTSVSTSYNDFGFSPAVGVSFNLGDKINLEGSVDYTHIFTPGSSTSWIGVVVGLEPGL
jgi:hypothetical protein